MQTANAPVEDLRLAAIVYGSTMLLTSVMYNVLWRYASTKRRLVDKKLSDDVLQKMTRRYLLSIPLYLLTLALALIKVEISFVLYLGIALFYALPTGVLTQWASARRKPRHFNGGGEVCSAFLPFRLPELARSECFVGSLNKERSPCLLTL